MAQKIVFVLSSDHSGSTWVGYVLGSHSDSAFLGEYSRAWGLGEAVPCTLCATRGLDACEVLHGIEQVAADCAFAFAFARTGKSMLVDNSKMLDWTGRFVGGMDAVYLVHVVKDPRNWLASRRRRTPEPSGALIGAWHDDNARIRDFCRRTGCPSTVVFYDELVADQVAGFTALFGFCGLDFERTALEYWTVPHHGFAANGASSALFGGDRMGRPPSHFDTGDAAFYAAHDRTLFADRRWRTDLSAEDQAAVRADPQVRKLLAQFGRRLTPDGLALVDLAPSERLGTRLRRTVVSGLRRLRA